MKMQPTQKQNQLAFDWSAPKAPSKAKAGLLEATTAVSEVPASIEVLQTPLSKEWQVGRVTEGKAEGNGIWLVRVLPWDFRSSFPEPVGEKFLQNLPKAREKRHAAIKDYHDKKARQGLMLLAGIDQFASFQRSDTHPDTGEPLASAEAKTEFRLQLEQEIRKSEEAFEKVIAVYEVNFGKPAGEAIRAAIRVWHLGGSVITLFPPTRRPLADSVKQAHFGYEEDGALVDPSDEEVSEITAELADYLRDVGDPDLRKSLLHQYVTDFGQEAADALDQWSQCINQVEEDGIAEFQYDPGHPWHYYREGDGAEPMPVEQIPAALKCELPTPPKNPRKRLALFQQMLVDQEQQLVEDCNRYTELVEKGAEALSEYDRSIAHDGDDDLARASAIALKFNHVRYGQARMKAIREWLGLS